LHTPSQPSPRRDEFWQDYKDKGFEYVLKKYAGYGFVGQSKKAAAKILNKLGLLHVAKRMLGRG
jgi:hypothetical protein